MPQPRANPVFSLDDPRVAAYRNLKDRELAREGGRFIAEGELVVRRLLESAWPVESVLLAERRVEEIAPLVPEGIPVYAAAAEVVNGIIGFRFHSGVMAVGVRRPWPTLDDLAQRWGERVTLVICPEITNTDNLGSLIRISAGLGADAMMLGSRCCDPLYRQAIRVSMGAVFYLPIVRSDDLPSLRERYGVELVAAVLDGSAEPLARAARPARLGVVLGNEAQGLGAEVVASCDRRVTIPMSWGTDSLNVSVAAGIVLYHFTHIARQC